MNSQNDTFAEGLAKGFPVILLAENDVLMRDALLVILHDAEYAVLAAADGREAIILSRAFEGEIALLVTDMIMPHIGGEELGELIMRERPGIRILQLSASSPSSFPDRNRSLAFLQKPFGSSRLRGKISEVLEGPTRIGLARAEES